MEKTIMNRDKVIVDKLCYGPRRPTSPFEIPWLKLFAYMDKKSITRADSVWWKYKRLSGYSRVEQKDIILFNHPQNHTSILIKRCIAVPNDTLQIVNSRVYVNNTTEIFPQDGKLRFRIYYNNLHNVVSLFDSLECSSLNDVHEPLEKYFILNITHFGKEIIMDRACVDSIFVNSDCSGSNKNSEEIGMEPEWTASNFGPVVIPSKGRSIGLNEKNISFYEPLISRFEGVNIQYKDNSIEIRGEVIDEYVFKQNYYFVLGDNRYESSDSRDWGLIPESLIIGRGAFVLFSRRTVGWKKMVLKIYTTF